jgi:hypothetical protein
LGWVGLDCEPGLGKGFWYGLSYLSPFVLDILVCYVEARFGFGLDLVCFELFIP